MTLDLRKVTAALGAEIVGVDLAGPLDPDMCEALRAALDEHLVLFARDQNLDGESQVALAQVFGEPMVHPFEAALGRTEPLHRIVDKPDTIPDRAGWHTDDSYLERPPVAAVLCCELAAEVGGDTAWANMSKAYENLSESMRDYLANHRGFHAVDGGLMEYMRRHLDDDTVERVVAQIGAGAEHPIVRTHPVTGRKAIFIEPNFMTRIVGLPRHESDFLCRFLASLANDVSIQCRFRWSTGDLAIWDERMTQHLGSADHAGSTRVMRRCTVAGERPR